MASFPKRLALPRLQLLALVLVLGAGLLPKMSEGDTGANPEGPIKPVRCWNVRCGSYPHCLKKPVLDDSRVNITECPSGYCSISVIRTARAGFISVIRECAEPGGVTCFKSYPDLCYRQNLTGDLGMDSDAYRNSALHKCFNSPPGKERAGADTGPHPESGTHEWCVCDKDLCNGKEYEWNGTLSPTPPTSRATRVKHLGCNVALVRALLVAVLHFRRMSLIG